MSIINLRLKKSGRRSCKIFIEKGATKLLPKYLKENKVGNSYAIITDTTVQKLFGDSLQKLLKKHGIKSEIITFPQGEKSKCMSTIESLAEQMVRKGFTRKDAILTLGGGVAGDIGGLLAAVYMRGIPYIHIPTTLLAMVDSAIGGKTGVDLTSGKNLIGTITQPHAVFIDTNYMKNFPDKHLINGMAEVIKYGTIMDKKLFKFLERNHEKILKRDQKTLAYIIERSAQDKCKVVRKDEIEKGYRIILNYGHTYGHALENLSNFRLLHGHAISIGMVIANRIAVEQGILKEKNAERIKKLLKLYGLPVVTMKKLLPCDIASDKKREGNHVNMVFPTKIGKTTLYKQKCT
jgi:3-dehydroquinate synthase